MKLITSVRLGRTLPRGEYEFSITCCGATLYGDAVRAECFEPVTVRAFAGSPPAGAKRVSE